MTIDQYKFHGAIMAELRRQFLEFWFDEAIPAMKDDDIEMTPEEQVEAMNISWKVWKRGGLENGSLAWFSNCNPNEQN